MDFKEQRAVLMIGQCKSITRAAAKLHLSQPALSRLLGTIEAELDLPLFIRDNKHFAVTQAGQLYMEKAQQILRCQAELEQGLRRLRQEERSLPLKIGIQTIRAPRLLPKLYDAFAAYWPECKASFEDGTRTELLQMLEHKVCDVIILSQVDLPPDLSVQVIRKDTLLLVAGTRAALPCEPCQDGLWDIVDLQQLAEKKFYLLEPRTTLYKLVADLVRQHKLVLPHCQEIGHQESALHMAVLNGGVTFTLDSYLSLFKLPRKACYYRVKQYLAPINYVVAYKKNRFTEKQATLLQKTLSPVFTQV